MNKDAWFVRYGSGLRISIQPASPTGWVITLVYAATVSAVSILVAVRKDPFWYLWAIFLATLTVVFVITAYRNSVPAETPSGRK
jgi:FtsH-binding integral membrane protein